MHNLSVFLRLMKAVKHPFKDELSSTKINTFILRGI